MTSMKDDFISGYTFWTHSDAKNSVFFKFIPLDYDISAQLPETTHKRDLTMCNLPGKSEGFS